MDSRGAEEIVLHSGLSDSVKILEFFGGPFTPTESITGFNFFYQNLSKRIQFRLRSPSID